MVPAAVHVAALLTAVCAGDQHAFAQFHGVFARFVYSVARRILRSNECAQEVASDVFVYLWSNARDYDATRGSVGAWLYVLTRSRALDVWRQRRRDHVRDDRYCDDEHAVEDLHPEHIIALSQSDSNLRRALSTLSPLRHQMIVLAFFDGLTHGEISQLVGMPLGTVKSHIRRALNSMRKRIQNDSGEVLRGEEQRRSPYDALRPRRSVGPLRRMPARVAPLTLVE